MSRATILVLAGVSLFGLGPVLARLAFAGGVDGLTLQVCRFGLGALGLWGWIALAPGPRPAIGRPDWAAAMLIGAALGCGSWCYLTSIRLLPVPVASLIFFTFPLMVAVLAHVLPPPFAARIRANQAAGLVVAFAGVAMIVGLGSQRPDWQGVLLSFAAAACVSLSYLVTPVLGRRIGALRLTAVATAVAAAGFILLRLAAGEGSLPADAAGWIGLVGNAAAYSFGLLALFAGLPAAGPTVAAMLSYLEPLVALAAAALVLGEVLEPLPALGALVVLGALWIGRPGR